MIEFDGVRSSALRVFVEKYPPRPIPKRKCEKFQVPGRSGDVIVFEDAWENVTQSYDIYVSAEKPGLPMIAAKAVRWLMGADGYRPLQDEYDRDTFRLAAYIGPVDLENTLNAFGRARIQFDCRPQRYLKSGYPARAMTNGQVLRNPTGYTARPLITVHGSGSGTLTIAGATLSLSVTDGMTLDCEEDEAFFYSSSVLNLNTDVSGDYPCLGAGASTVSWTGGITGIELAPRWYEL